MLEELASTAHGFPDRFLKSGSSDTEEDYDKAFEKWKGILTEMAFLFRESNPSTSQKKNPYEEEHSAAFKKFIKHFGFGGKWVKKKDGTRVFISRLSDIPKYRELDENYRRSSRELCEYRANCRKKALSMFVEYFNDLWD